jgi:outer membrane immunogenic protein
MHLRRFVLALGVLSVTCVGAAAADLPMKAPPMVAPMMPPPFSWTGCYIGGNVGGAWSRRSADEATIPIGFNAGPGSVDLDGSGFIGGGHIGCNYQFSGNWVVGIEGDWSGTNIDNSASAPNTFLNGTPVGSGSIDFSESIKWIATIRGRFGVAVQPNLLLYVTGGGAWERSDLTGLHTYASPCPNCSLTSVTSSETGWTIGGGIEWAPWSNNWLVRAEYLYYHFNGLSSVGLQQSNGATTTNWNWGDLSVSEARVGVSYKF